MFGFLRKRPQAVAVIVGPLPRVGRLPDVLARPGEGEPVFSLCTGDRCVLTRGQGHEFRSPDSDQLWVRVECMGKGSGWVVDGILDYCIRLSG